jgi:hypothetical protein
MISDIVERARAGGYRARARHLFQERMRIAGLAAAARGYPLSTASAITSMLAA